MTIRDASDNDIPAIVGLLKMSLGESLMPKSESYWRWKHLENPFGKSKVLVAEESGQLIGVRAFLCWQWMNGPNRIHSFRAVDTATHPEFQGKGIFKTLTMKLVEQCQKAGVSFVFNTPNGQSKPGYLKMGWQEAGRLPIRVSLVNPFVRLLKKYEFKPVPFADWLQQHEDANLKLMARSSEISTAISVKYLKWRYVDVPVAEYFIVWKNESDGGAIYRLKPGRFGMEFRITQWLVKDRISNSLWQAVAHSAGILGCRLITSSGALNNSTRGFVFDRGPEVTVRSLGWSTFHLVEDFNTWKPTLGDMELF